MSECENVANDPVQVLETENSTRKGHVKSEKLRTVDVSVEKNVNFSSLLLSDNVIDGLHKAGFYRPSPIQLKAIPLGRCGLDLIVQAKSGTGKTCVFTVIALEGVVVESKSLQVLVLAPTREIAVQIQDVMYSIGQCIPGLQCHTFIGGLPVHEDKQKLKLCHIAVGTPGRIKQLIEEKILSTDNIRLLILDEADKLLEESFQEQINWIYSTMPENKQMVALSATYPEYLAQHLKIYMRNPTFVRLNSIDPALLGVKQFYKAVNFHPIPHVAFENKVKHLVKLLSSVDFHQCLIFSNFQSRAETLSNILNNQGLPSACIAGCLDQKQRLEAMNKLRNFQCRVLISTDLTSRGIDVDKINLVINLDLPKDHETYLHRIGRAGRFGSYGVAITYVCRGKEEDNISSVEQLCNTFIEVLPDPVPSDLVRNDKYLMLDDIVTTEHIDTNASEGDTVPAKGIEKHIGLDDLVVAGCIEASAVLDDCVTPDHIDEYSLQENGKSFRDIVDDSATTVSSVEYGITSNGDQNLEKVQNGGMGLNCQSSGVSVVTPGAQSEQYMLSNDDIGHQFNGIQDSYLETSRCKSQMVGNSLPTCTTTNGEETLQDSINLVQNGICEVSSPNDERKHVENENDSKINFENDEPTKNYAKLEEVKNKRTISSGITSVDIPKLQLYPKTKQKPTCSFHSIKEEFLQYRQNCARKDNSVDGSETGSKPNDQEEKVSDEVKVNVNSADLVDKVARLLDNIYVTYNGCKSVAGAVKQAQVSRETQCGASDIGKTGIDDVSSKMCDQINQTGLEGLAKKSIIPELSTYNIPLQQFVNNKTRCHQDVSVLAEPKVTDYETVVSCDQSSQKDYEGKERANVCQQADYPSRQSGMPMFDKYNSHAREAFEEESVEENSDYSGSEDSETSDTSDSSDEDSELEYPENQESWNYVPNYYGSGNSASYGYDQESGYCGHYRCYPEPSYCHGVGSYGNYCSGSQQSVLQHSLWQSYYIQCMSGNAAFSTHHT